VVSTFIYLYCFNRSEAISVSEMASTVYHVQSTMHVKTLDTCTDWTEQGLTSHQTHYGHIGDGLLWVK